MYPVSDEFLSTIRKSHNIATRLDITKSDGTVLETLYPSDGDVTIDATRKSRRECSFTIPDITGSLTPASPSDLLSPLSGNELRPYRGVYLLSTGEAEMVPLGVMPIRSATTSLDSDGVPIITVGGMDRSSTVSRNQWTDVFSLPAEPVETTLAAILNNRAPTYPYNLPTTGVSLSSGNLGVDYTNDPWQDMVDIAFSAGYEVFFDANGVLTLASPKDPATVTVANINYWDDASSVTITANKDWDATESFNGCVVIGQNSNGSPVRGIAWDDDPESPTYYLGPYGTFPEIITTDKVLTDSQALTAATAQLARRRGVGQNVSWDQIVNPALDANDVVSFSQASLRVEQLLTVISSLTIPWLADGQMSATTRTRQIS